MLRRILFGFFLFMILAANCALAQRMPRANLFDQMDSDKNGLISEEEWHAAMQKRFEAMDKNRDGNLSREEWQEMRETMRERLRSRMRNR